MLKCFIIVYMYNLNGLFVRLFVCLLQKYLAVLLLILLTGRLSLELMLPIPLHT